MSGFQLDVTGRQRWKAHSWSIFVRIEFGMAGRERNKTLNSDGYALFLTIDGKHVII
jgi:hypothetical protein